MNIIEAIKTRKSIRDFTADPVPQHILKKILEAACHAPSAENSQPWEFTIIAGDKLDTIRKANIEKLKSKAPRHPDLPGVMAYAPATLVEVDGSGIDQSAVGQHPPRLRREEGMLVEEGHAHPHIRHDARIGRQYAVYLFPIPHLVRIQAAVVVVVDALVEGMGRHDAEQARNGHPDQVSKGVLEHVTRSLPLVVVHDARAARRYLPHARA